MVRFLFRLGLTVLAVGVVMLIAAEAGVLPASLTDAWLLPALQAGGLSLAAAVVLSLLAPFRRMATQGRCVRCGIRIEKSQTYCHDHLKTTVQEVQERARGRL